MAAIPGIPPIFSVMIVYIADKQGIFKKYGIDIEIRPFDNGTAAARAVVAGDADISWSPTPPVINQISNASVPLVAVYGMPNPDWVIGTTEAGKTCKNIKGQEVGVDSVGGARSVALRSMLGVCHGVTIEDTKQVALGGGAGAAMIAGRLQYGVLHLDDIAEIEAQGKKLNILLRQKDTDPIGHYLMLVVRKDKLAANRDAIVRATAAMIESARYINDPKNLDVVAEACMITGHNKEIAKAARPAVHRRQTSGRPTTTACRATSSRPPPTLMKKIGAIKADKRAGDLRQPGRHQRLERCQRDGEMNSAIRRHAPFWLSIAAGIAAWEIAGRSTSAAFMVPFSETLVRLWQLVRTAEFVHAQFLDSATLFLSGFVLALVVGMPLGMLLARMRALRIGIEPYIMIIYATPMVALIPFILSMMGFGFSAKLLVVFLFAVFPVLYNTVEGARSIKPELIEVARFVPLRRVGAVARGDAALHPALRHDRRASGDRAGAGRHDCGGILFERHRPRPANHGRFAEFRHRRRVRVYHGDRAHRRRTDAARPQTREPLRTLEKLGRDRIRDCVSPLRVAAARKRSPLAGRMFGTVVPRVIVGLALLLLWEFVVRALAPAYVAKPTTVLMAIPRVIADPAFQTATRATLAAVAEGLAIALLFGTIIGLLMGRSPAIERGFRHYVNGFYAIADDRGAAAVLAVVRLFRRHPDRHHHLRGDLLHHHQRRRRRPLGAARVSRGGALIPLRPGAHAGRDRIAVVDALSAGRLPAGGRPRADRRGGGGILPLDRRARLLHPLQFALLSSQRSLRRRAAARRIRCRLRVAGELVHAAFHAVVSPRRKNGLISPQGIRYVIRPLAQGRDRALGPALRRQRRRADRLRGSHRLARVVQRLVPRLVGARRAP